MMNEVMNADVAMNELMSALQPLRQSNPKLNAHQVSYIAASGGDSKGVHHVSASGWRRLNAIMDSGSADCMAQESVAKNIPLGETEASRQGQTYHTADGGVIKNKGEMTVTMYRARYQITDVTRPLNSISRVCCSHRQEVGS